LEERVMIKQNTMAQRRQLHYGRQLGHNLMGQTVS
jgi:hypothetical protein